jgi:hypothetical protein
MADCSQKGSDAAQAVLPHFVQTHRSELERVLMVGMCGELQENVAKEGMVILARQVFNDEPARIRDVGFAWSPTGY